jgi:outer membrane protein TolC
MESLSRPGANAGRAVHMQLIVATAMLAFVTPGMLAGQSMGIGSTRGDSVKTRTAESSTRLRLGTVYDELRKASPRIQAAEALARAARARISGAGLPPDPQVQFGWMNYELPSLKPMEVLGMKQLQVMQMLPLGGKLGLSRRIARERATAQSERAKDAWWEVRALAAMPFYELYRADQSLVVMRETLRLLGDIREVADAMYRVGSGNQADVLRAQVEIARMTEDTLRMQAMRTGMTARLNAILDRPQLAAVESPALPAFPKAIPSLDSLEQLAYAARPMLRAGAAELSAAESMERLARKELLPDLQLGVQYAQRGKLVSDGGMSSGSVSGTERMGSLMIGASLPVFARSRQLKLREEATAMRQMATSELTEMRANTRGALGERFADLVRARRLAALYRNTIIPQSRAAVSSAFAAYRVGKVDFMTLLDNQMTVNKYRQELVALEAEEGRAWAELEMLTGAVLFDPNATSGAAFSGDDK